MIKGIGQEARFLEDHADSKRFRRLPANRAGQARKRSSKASCE